MIYNESTKSFIKLETALKELGFDQQTIDLALEYLDITKPRNNDLMRKITTRYYPKLMQYSYREKLIKAVKSEIINSDSKELKDRKRLNWGRKEAQSGRTNTYRFWDRQKLRQIRRDHHHLTGA